MSLHDICLNLRSLMWGVGAKQYPSSWWLGTLRRFHTRFDVGRVVFVRQLLLWENEGKGLIPGLGDA